MSLTSFLAGPIAAACRDNAAAVAKSLGRCFDRTGAVSPGEPAAWEMSPDDLNGPGLAVRIGTADVGLLALIPADLPLSAWHELPNDTRISRLRTLAAEWGAALLPQDMWVDVTDADAVTDLAAAAAECLPDASADLIPLTVEGSGTIYLLTPVTRLVPTAAPVPPAAPAVDRAAPPIASAAVPQTFMARPAADPARQRLGRLLNVPVQVVVRLAEKKIEVGQFLSIAPGALITFGKNCEDLLDLYVNNRLYCRGEAVKIGEHFGLKINEVGAVNRREERVF